MSDVQHASIIARGIKKQFGGKPVLRELALTIAPGAIFGLFGPLALAVGLWAACTGLLHWRLRAR